jgi:hypothetical protein
MITRVQFHLLFCLFVLDPLGSKPKVLLFVDSGWQQEFGMGLWGGYLCCNVRC